MRPRIEKKQSPLVKTLTRDYDYCTSKVIGEALAKTDFIPSDDIKKRIKESAEYYGIGRVPVQAEFMIFAYEELNKNLKITDDLIRQLQVLMVTIEMVQAYYFFSDDFEDNATERLGKRCWHLLNNTGLLAYTDSCLMRSLIDEIVRQNFKGELRDHILSIYHKVYFMTTLGQYIETTTARSRNYDTYTFQLYETMNRLKSSPYAVKAPILIALALSNKLNEESYNTVDKVGDDIGVLVQIHNDFIDYHIMEGTASGKTGNDVTQGKCSWVTLAVLERCNAEQLRLFKENYGSTDTDKLNRIRQLYKEMDVPKLYELEEKTRLNNFLKKVNELPADSTPSADFFKKFYNIFCSHSQDTTKFMYVV
ncbi:uncharacterized protein [Battus philenor]|uniref:uncharacterized protein n=1 Tax=Battus philenor TaxID=42288 RepID=UPI0035CFCC16